MKEKEMQWILKEKYNGVETAQFYRDCQRLKDGEPLGYIIGFVPFLNCTIWLTSHPLIPRTETEFWTEQVITDAHSRGYTSPPRILDLCAGSGCIGVALARNIEDARVDFAEIDTQHHSTILQNLSENGLDASFSRIFGGSLFEEVPSNGRYDIIVTNPPYIDEALGRVDSSVHAHEPHNALYGGMRGLECIESIVKSVPRFLSHDGMAYIEHEPEQVERITEYADRVGLSITTHNDQYKQPRYSTLHVAQ